MIETVFCVCTGCGNYISENRHFGKGRKVHVN
uniref:Uncharacterized protein n=1 Tax=Anguilla anguilla TaxID=7936 RepID=A0A0E9R1E6_ANGAN